MEGVPMVREGPRGGLEGVPTLTWVLESPNPPISGGTCSPKAPNSFSPCIVASSTRSSSSFRAALFTSCRGGWGEIRGGDTPKLPPQPWIPQKGREDPLGGVSPPKSPRSHLEKAADGAHQLLQRLLLLLTQHCGMGGGYLGRGGQNGGLPPPSNPPPPPILGCAPT